MTDNQCWPVRTLFRKSHPCAAILGVMYFREPIEVEVSGWYDVWPYDPTTLECRLELVEATPHYDVEPPHIWSHAEEDVS